MVSTSTEANRLLRFLWKLRRNVRTSSRRRAHVDKNALLTSPRQAQNFTSAGLNNNFCAILVYPTLFPSDLVLEYRSHRLECQTLRGLKVHSVGGAPPTTVQQCTHLEPHDQHRLEASCAISMFRTAPHRSAVGSHLAKVTVERGVSRECWDVSC